MKKLTKASLLVAAALAFGLAAVACDDPDPSDNLDPEDPVKYTVSYAIGEGATGTAPAGGQYVEGAKFNIADSTGFEKEDYTFYGWSDGSTVYNAGAEYTMPAENVTFTAQWQDADAPDDSDDPDDSEGSEDTENPENPDVQYLVGYDTTDMAALALEIGGENGKLFVYNDATGKETETELTYTLNGEALTIVLDGKTFTGTYNSVSGFNIILTLNDKSYDFAPQSPLADPMIVFKSNGGTGSAPTVTLGAYNENLGYKFVLPENTFNAPQGKEFKTWRVGDNEYNTYAPGSSYYAKKGETLFIYAVWQDIVEPVPADTKEYIGNVYLPERGDFESAVTYVKITLDFSGLQATVVDNTGKEKTVSITEDNNSIYKPDTYGNGAYYYTGVKLGTISNYELLVSADRTRVWVCYNDEPMDSGEFITTDSDRPVEPDEPVEHTVSFWVEEDCTTQTVQYGAKVVKPADPTSSQGKTFRYWTDEDGVEYDFNTAVTKDIELTAAFAWKVTFSAGEGSGSVDPVWIKIWTPTSLTLPAATGLSNNGKVFAGWSDGEETYQPGERYYKGGLGNVTFTAVWEDAATEPDDPDDSEIGGKLYDYAGEGSANAVLYGYSSQADAIAAGNGLTAEGTSGEKTFYYVKVYYNASTAASNPNKLFIYIYYSSIASVANTATGNAVIDDVNAENKPIEIVTTSSWGYNFTVEFSMNESGKRTVTVTYNGQSVTWVEITA